MEGIGKVKAMIERLEGFEEVLRNELYRVMMDHEDIIVKMITDDQLYNRGINGEGVEIADYQPYTLNTRIIKSFNNQPTDRVTLRDTGAFHASMYVSAESWGDFVIISADEKTDALITKYGIEILALTDENFEKLINNYVRPELVEAMKKYIFDGK